LLPVEVLVQERVPALGLALVYFVLSEKCVGAMVGSGHDKFLDFYSQSDHLNIEQISD